MANQDSALLEIRFHLADGSVEEFYQQDEILAKRILDGIRPAQLFKQSRIMIAGDYSMTGFIPSHVLKLDVISRNFACWEFPAGLSDVVEISESIFREKAGLDDHVRLQKREQSRVVGDSFVAFVDLEMRGNVHVFLMIEGAVALPAERLTRVQLFLSGTTMHARLPEGGMSILNLANLVRFTAFPGPAGAPSDAWPAHHRTAPNLDFVA